MSQYINEAKAYKMAKEIWSKHFRHLMSFDVYYYQIKADLITYFALPDCLKPMFARYKENMVDMTYRQLQRLKMKK